MKFCGLPVNISKLSSKESSKFFTIYVLSSLNMNYNNIHSKFIETKSTRKWMKMKKIFDLFPFWTPHDTSPNSVFLCSFFVLWDLWNEWNKVSFMISKNNREKKRRMKENSNSTTPMRVNQTWIMRKERQQKRIHKKVYRILFFYLSLCIILFFTNFFLHCDFFPCDFH